MLKYIFCLIFLLPFSTNIFSEEPDQNKDVWKVLYEGKWSLSHKMVFCRPTHNSSDEITSLCMLAYAKYRCDKKEEALTLFKCIDEYIEVFYLRE